VGHSRLRPPSPARRRSALRRLTGTSGSPQQNSEEVAAELGRTLDFVKVPSARMPKSWQPSPPTKTRSLPATSALSAAETVFVGRPRLVPRGRPLKRVQRPVLRQAVLGNGLGRRDTAVHVLPMCFPIAISGKHSSSESQLSG
jgi:hypothetical protein